MTARTGTRINPQTGRMETYDLPPPVDLQRSRRELRDMLQGNTKFHTDPNAAPPPPAPAPEPGPVDHWGLSAQDLFALDPADWPWGNPNP